MKNRKIILTILSISLISLTSCDSKLVFKEIKGKVEIHSEHQLLYLEDDNYNNIGKYAAYSAKEGYANPLPVNLSWSGGKAPYVLSISENEDFSSSLTFETNNKSFDFYNAKIDTTYYWKVSDKDNVEVSSSFVTNSIAPRNIFVDGVDNMRDLGGYQLSSGQRIKQGLIYRSGEFNKNNNASMILNITDTGLDMIDELNIKTDIDLRRNYEKDSKIETSNITSSPLGDDVNYVQAPMHYGGENFLDNSDPLIDAMNKSSIKIVFETIADANNLPVVFHCVQGKDRTGFISYLIEGLLGVSEIDIYRDYLFTNFSSASGSACKSDDIDNRYGATIQAVEGDNLSQKIYKYLNETLLISEEVLDAVIDNLK